MASAEQHEVQAVLDVLLRLAGADLDARVELSGGDRPIDLIAIAINMLADELQASMATEASLRSELEREVAARRLEVEALAQAQATVEKQTQAIRELSTPVLHIWDGILVSPLVGLLDEARGRQLQEQLLSTIARSASRVAIVDVTGVAAIDTAVADQLRALVEAARLLGTQVIVTGISPENALTLVRLGVEFSEIHTEASLAAGLRRGIALAAKARH